MIGSRKLNSPATRVIIPVMVRAGKLVPAHGGELPKLREGAAIDLVTEEGDFLDREELERFNREDFPEILPAGSEMFAVIARRDQTFHRVSRQSLPKPKRSILQRTSRVTRRRAGACHDRRVSFAWLRTASPGFGRYGRKTGHLSHLSGQFFLAETAIAFCRMPQFRLRHLRFGDDRAQARRRRPHPDCRNPVPGWEAGDGGIVFQLRETATGDLQFHHQCADTKRICPNTDQVLIQVADLFQRDKPVMLPTIEWQVGQIRAHTPNAFFLGIGTLRTWRTSGGKMKGQPDRISRYGFHPVSGIGRNQKKVAGLQRYIPAGIKP